ncbi:Rieske 2Fe-2S domain-containing protein [Actinomadura mexicana]|uniref:Ferredoxin subunit of nitrite reductase or a ring-hydroxylating dioxygenase n=1 Tax=Actinomadura mexicana TaxID=134959 RepID=A0A239D2J6_9ACTN|nr:Rieske 2Fe-2S domain-containing protein [Actinomadura mexicana]SNS26570.1 Ferredoxin subunit of nitrite reductase or a ring-hydroxylating dioxygenase [Actinomadura mexicana]
MSMPHRAVHRLENAEALDKVAEPVSSAVQRAVRPRLVRDLLSGTKLGHPLHPVLTDVVIGAWSMAGLLDVAGGPGAEPAADLLTAAGVAAAVPTALTGLNDWADTLGAERRVGLVHAGLNTAALGLYAASLVASARGGRRKGKALRLAGLAAMGASAYLGGHLTFTRGLNVNRTAWQHGPEDWTPVLAASELAEGEHRTADADGVRILLYRTGTKLHAVAATCTHLGGPLGEGTIENDCVTCPWHGSTFRLEDGGIERGPATSPQPSYETRIQDGRIEVRVPPPGTQSDMADEGTHRRARHHLIRTPAS